MEEKDTVVLLHTTEGNIKIKLYGNTPIHRDNFITHVKDGVYDSVLFHRVINEFMIQAGDPSSKTAVSGTLLGASSTGEELTAEFVAKIRPERKFATLGELTQQINRDSILAYKLLKHS